MAAKVHCETNLNVVFSNKNANTEAQNNSRLGDHCTESSEGIILLKGNQTCSRKRNYSDSSQERMDGFEGQDMKEIIKQTMVKQEEIFQEQVRELHRVYRVQKLLMAEIKAKTSSTPKLAATTQTSPFMLQFGLNHLQSESKRNFWDHNGFVTDKGNMRYTQPTCGRDREQSLCPGFLEQSVQIGLSPTKTRNGLPELFSLQPSKATRRIFDLEQPAEQDTTNNSAYPNDGSSILRTVPTKTAKEEKPLNFGLFLEPDTDLQLTLGTGCRNAKMKSKCHKTPSGLGLSIPEFAREHTSECRDSMSSDDLRLFPPDSVRSESSVQEQIKTLGGTRLISHGHKNQQDFRDEWQRFGIQDEKSMKERHSLDLQIGERSRQETIEKPPWCLKAFNLN